MATSEIIDAYMNAWNETDEAKRRALLDTAWADAGVYTDPMSDVTGREALVELIASFHKQMPGATIAMASGIDSHHDRVRFAWKLLTPQGATQIEGIDVGQLAADGRLQSITGFWGSPPAT
jgi:hypothetical protein